MKNTSSKDFNTTYFLLFLFLNISCFAQNFTWKKGSNLTDIIGIYGTQGTPATANRPGSREQSITWTDAAGNFWLFGGNGFDSAGNLGFLNDLWRYNTSTNEWTWVKGSNTVNQVGIYGFQGLYNATSRPGARKSATFFKDALGIFWLFGGYGYDSFGSFGELNDLWSYNPATNEWRWMKGSTACFQVGTYGTMGTANVNNTPGARHLATAWTDGNGEFWLFGGLGYNGSSNAYLNDLWRYNSSNNQWIWVRGTALLNQTGIYGTIGTPAPANAPGARVSAPSWTDGLGNLWLIAGYGYATGGPADLLNDMWKYTVLTNEWTWVKGSNNTLSQQGSYGTLGVFAPLNVPGARYDATTWLDGAGDLWLFGGYGFGTSATLDYLNDLWRYNVTSNQWKWVKGANTVSQPAIYGLQGVNSPFNMPGSRSAAARWKDASNNLWLLGGSGYNVANNVGKLNDLWKFDNCIGPTMTITSTSPSVCAGNAATLTINGANTYTWITGQISPTLVISPNGTTSYTAFGTDLNECKDTTDFTLNVQFLPILKISSSNTVICPFNVAALTASGAVNYTWSTNQNIPTVTVSPMITTIYTVTGVDAFNCVGFTSFSQSVALCVGIDQTSQQVNPITIFPNPSKGEISIRSNVYGKVDLVIFNGLGQKVFEQSFESSENKLHLNMDKGIYYYQVKDAYNQITTGKLILE